MAWITVGPDIEMTPRHREVYVCVNSDTSMFANLSVDKPGLSFNRSPIRLTAGVAASVLCTVKNSNTTYTVTATNTAGAESGSCTIKVLSQFTSYDMEDTRDAIATALESLTASYEPRTDFSRGLVPTYSEDGLSDVKPRSFFVELESIEAGEAREINLYSYSIYVMYETLYESDMVEIRNHLNDYDWPVGITSAYCDSIARSEIAEEIPCAVCSLTLSIYS